MLKNSWKQSNSGCHSESLIPNRLDTEILLVIFISPGMSEISFHHWSGTDYLLSWVSQHLYSAQIILRIFPLSFTGLALSSLCEPRLGLLHVVIRSIFLLEGFYWETAGIPLLWRCSHTVLRPLPDTARNSIFVFQHIQIQHRQDHPIRESTIDGILLLKYFGRFQPPWFFAPGFLVVLYYCINCAGKISIYCGSDLTILFSEL